MFESIADKLQQVFKTLKGQARLSETNIRDAMRQVRLALLEADVHFKVVKEFVDQVTAKAIGEEVLKNITPGQQVVKIVHDELLNLLGQSDTSFRVNPSGPTVVMLVGLQGSGKTTTCGKLAKYLESKGRKPLLVAADVQRPAAIEQLKVLGKTLNLPVYSEEGKRVTRICERGVTAALEQARDTVILDTAGRLHVDEALMAELKEIKEKVRPQEAWLVVDAMTGQDAVASASAFHEKFGIDGIILTKLDGDARGGAAISIRKVTGRPIKFVGVGEKLDKLEEFHPDRMASRILGMGDVVSLVERAQQVVDEKDAQEMQQKFRDASFNLEDFLKQLRQLKKMGSLKDLLALVPGLGKEMEGMEVEEKELGAIEAMILSMTPAEREDPESISHARKLRIARGSGMALQDVNGLLKQFKMMKKMMKDMKRLGKRHAMGGFPGANRMRM